MRRRRLIGRRSLAIAGPKTPVIRGDLTYLQHVVALRFPVASAREYLRRAMGQRIEVRLVDVRRGERVGVVRSVEIQHDNGGDRSRIRGERRLANGDPASLFVPEQLVHIHAVADGPIRSTATLGPSDVIVLHVPVRGYLRFLPAVFQGDGPVEERTAQHHATNALQVAGGGAPPTPSTRTTSMDEDPLRRFLFVFQHVMTSVTDRIDDLENLTNPLHTEARFLPWLASWVGFELDQSLPLHQQRELVRKAIRLYRSRGTRGGIEEMVGVLTSAPVRVRERVKPRGMVLGRATLAGGRDVAERYARGEPASCYLFRTDRRNTTFFALLLEARDAFRDRYGERAPHVLRRIVDVVSRERPAHIWFTLQFDETE